MELRHVCPVRAGDTGLSLLASSGLTRCPGSVFKAVDFVSDSSIILSATLVFADSALVSDAPLLTSVSTSCET